MEIVKHLVDVAKDKAELGNRRSSKWPTARKHHLKLHPVCEVCGGSEKLEVHHIEPYHLNPERELDPTNMITLCEGKKFVNCHLLFGHLGSYKNINPNVVEDAANWIGKLKSVK
jgi:5-methylcytosine-specific restriction protein A